MPIHVQIKNTNVDYPDISTGVILYNYSYNYIHPYIGIGTGKRARGHGPYRLYIFSIGIRCLPYKSTLLSLCDPPDLISLISYAPVYASVTSQDQCEY